MACSVIDDNGVQIALSTPAHRIITLAPDLTEIIIAIGAKSALIGTIKADHFSPALTNVALVGSYASLDLERIIALKPDLIITWGDTFTRQLAVLKKMNLPIYVNEPHHLIDVIRTLKNMGCLTGQVAKANQIAAQFDSRMHALQREVVGKKPMKVFYQIGAYSYFTINKNSWIDDVITLCGGKNIFADIATLSPEVTLESIIVANPEVILASADNDNWKARWQKRQSVAAVKHNALFTISPDLIERAGPQLMKGAMQICQDLHYLREGLNNERGSAT